MYTFWYQKQVIDEEMEVHAFVCSVHNSVVVSLHLQLARSISVVVKVKSVTVTL